MNLEIELLKTYELCEKEKLVDNCQNILEETVLLPVYHSNRKSDGKNIIELVFNKNGEVDYTLSNFIEKDKYIIYPVTENSAIRSSNAQSHPLADELSYIYPDEKSSKSALYLKELSDWLDFEEDSLVKKFLETIYSFVINNNVSDVVETIVISSGKSNIKIDKIFITFKVLGLDNGRDVSVSSSKKIHSSYIKYVESINETREKRFCNITGKEKYCTNKHRGMMGTAKLISASNNLEVYIGRFDRDGNDIVSIAYETSQKIHNMIKYLLENPNSRKWLGGNVYLMTWFSDDVSNDNKIDITEPEDIIFEDDFALDDYAVIGESTKKLIKSIDLGSEFDSSISAYVLILDKVSNGRIAINYFQNLPKSDFANNILHWKSTFNWYFYSKAEGAYIKSTPSNRTTLLALYGVERKGRLEANNDEMLISNNLRLISCILERKKIPLDMYRIACNNIRTRNRYKNTWNNVCAVALAIINKYYLDLGKERMDKTMIEKTVQSRSYVYGRILYLLEYTEKESTEDSSRITNAAKFWNNYVQYPRKTLLNIQNKVQVYRTRLLKSAKAWKLIKIDKEMGECIELLERMNEINSDLNKDKPLNEEFIFGYYAQQTKLFTKNENKETK